MSVTVSLVIAVIRLDVPIKVGWFRHDRAVPRLCMHVDPLHIGRIRNGH
jgi:hypothetical protein